MKMVPSTDYPEIIEKYNSEGENATKAYLKDKYGLKKPGQTLSYMRRNPELGYDNDTDRFYENPHKDADSIFMSLDDLCSSSVTQQNCRSQSAVVDSPDAMERLVRTLVSDRLLELSKYVSVDSFSRVIRIDQSTMMMDGYTVHIQ